MNLPKISAISSEDTELVDIYSRKNTLLSAINGKKSSTNKSEEIDITQSLFNSFDTLSDSLLNKIKTIRDEEYNEKGFFISLFSNSLFSGITAIAGLGASAFLIQKVLLDGGYVYDFLFNLTNVVSDLLHAGGITLSAMYTGAVQQDFITEMSRVEGTQGDPLHKNGYASSFNQWAVYNKTNKSYDLTTMTIKQVIELQRYAIANPDLFPRVQFVDPSGKPNISTAAGKAGFMWDTLLSIIRDPNSGVKGDDIFNQQTQDKMTQYLFDKIGWERYIKDPSQKNEDYLVKRLKTTWTGFAARRSDDDIRQFIKNLRKEHLGYKIQSNQEEFDQNKENYFIGDSIAHYYKLSYSGAGVTRIGASPSDIINMITQSDVEGKNVFLSTGFSNSPYKNMENVITNQISGLQLKNPASINVFGVSKTYPSKKGMLSGDEMNNILSNICNTAGVTFLGGFDAAKDNIHPKSKSLGNLQQNYLPTNTEAVSKYIHFTKNTGDEVHFNKLESSFRNKIIELAMIYYKLTNGKKLQINSSFRSRAEQQRIHDEYLETSRHIYGLAVDINTEDAILLTPYLYKLGLTHGKGKETHHIQQISRENIERARTSVNTHRQSPIIRKKSNNVNNPKPLPKVSSSRINTNDEIYNYEDEDTQDELDYRNHLYSGTISATTNIIQSRLKRRNNVVVNINDPQYVYPLIVTNN